MQGPENVHDRRAVSIRKSGVIVGHVSQEISSQSWWQCQLQSARETNTRTWIRSSMHLRISRKEETFS